MSRYKAVIFDFDDTLVKTYAIKMRQYLAVAKDAYGLNLTEADVRKHWGKSYEQFHLDFYQNADTLENLIQAKLAREAEFPVEPQPGALEIIRNLQEEGTAMGILSSSSRLVVRPDLKRLGFNLADFVAIQTSESTSVHKPDPRVFEPILGHLANHGIRDRIVYVGDALHDYAASHAAGLDFIAVTTGLHSAEQFRRAGAAKIIPNLAGLSQALAGGAKR